MFIDKYREWRQPHGGFQIMTFLVHKGNFKHFVQNTECFFVYFYLLTFGGAWTIGLRRFFYYNIKPSICQGKVRENLHKNLSQNADHFVYCAQTTIVVLIVQKILKKVLTNK